MALDTDILTDADEVTHLVSPIALGHHVIPGFRARSHQRLISQAIIDAVQGIGPRFIAISIPQQYGKSLVSSVLTPVLWLEWHVLGLVPGGLVGIVSYEDSLAMSFSRKVRRLIEENPDIFNVRLSKSSKAASFWETESPPGEDPGGIIAVGTGGSIQGRSISLFIIDDPTKNTEQAQSEKHRETLWDFWNGIAFGRLQPWTIVLVIHTRFRDDDLIGRLMSTEYEGDPKEWRYIRIPAVCDSEDDMLGREIDEPLIRPQSDQTLEQAREEMAFVKANISTYAWNTLWMQHPVDPEGTIFFEKEWRYWGGELSREERYELPSPTDFEQALMAWDMTFKDKKDNDWVVGQAWAGRGADRYLIDEVRGHWGLTETCNRVKSFAERIRHTYPKATTILVEDKANGPAVIDALRSTVGGLVEFDPGDYGDKVQRAWACQPLLLGRNLYIPAPSEKAFVRDYVKELGDFPRGNHDDRVDATTMALLYMNKYRYRPIQLVTPRNILVPRQAPIRTPTSRFPSRRW